MITQHTTTGGWPTTRILSALAAVVTLGSVLLAVTVSSWFLLLAVAVGVDQLVLVAVGACPASKAIHALRTRPAAAR